MLLCERAGFGAGRGNFIFPRSSLVEEASLSSLIVWWGETDRGEFALLPGCFGRGCSGVFRWLVCKRVILVFEIFSVVGQ